MATTEFSDEWELSKENVRPRKQGRNVSSLSAALQSQDDQMIKIKQEKQEFQARVARGLMVHTGGMDTGDVDPLVGREEEELDEEQRTALGQLSGKGSQASIESDAKPKQIPGMGFQIYNDENADPANRPQQTGEWETVPKTGCTNRENEQKPGQWNKARVNQKNMSMPPPTPSFTVHIDDDVKQPMV